MYRRIERLLLLVALLFVGSPLLGKDDRASDDEKTLLGAGIKTDDASLLLFFRQR